MKRVIIISLFIITAVIFETSVFPLFFSSGNAPDLVAIFLISATIVFGFRHVWLITIAAGFILDIFSYSRIGVNVIAFIAFCYLASFFSRRLLLEEKIEGIAVGSFLILVETFFYEIWVFSANMGFKINDFRGLKYVLLEGIGWKLLFNLILFFVSLLFFKRLEKAYSSKKLIIGN
ncbi:MAG: rod shape-determining protein MreD [bacterium]|nr:rod shape-determining protein MreD [bacterium]